MPKPKSPNQARPRPKRVTEPGWREEVTLEQAPIEARLRYENAEKWIAWAPDWKSVIAADKDFHVAHEAARLAGYPNALMEWVPPVTGAIWE